MVQTILADPAFYSNHFAGKPTYRSSKTNNAGSEDLLIAKFSGATFMSEWMTYYGSNPFNAGAISGANTVALDAANNMYVGVISNSTTFEVVGAPVVQQLPCLTVSTSFDGVILKFGCNGTPCVGCRKSNSIETDEQSISDNLVHIYPNPFNESFTVQLQGTLDEKYKIALYDLKGILYYLKKQIVVKMKK